MIVSVIALSMEAVNEISLCPCSDNECILLLKFMQFWVLCVCVHAHSHTSLSVSLKLPEPAAPRLRARCELGPRGR